MQQGWLKTGLIVFSAAIVLRTLVERRPDKLSLIIPIAMIGIAVVAIGWLFAVRRRR